MYGNRVASLGLLVLRLVVGILFALHGAQKLFTGMLPGFGSSLTRMGVPLPNVAAVLVAFVEFIGGVLLIAGLFTRVAAALIAIDMVFAIFLVHLRRGFFNQGGGFEFPLTLFAASVALLCVGAGAWSLDRWLHAPTADQPFDSRSLAQGRRQTTTTNDERLRPTTND